MTAADLTISTSWAVTDQTNYVSVNDGNQPWMGISVFIPKWNPVFVSTLSPGERVHPPLRATSPRREKDSPATWRPYLGQLWSETAPTINYDLSSARIA